MYGSYLQVFGTYSMRVYWYTLPVKAVYLQMYTYECWTFLAVVSHTGIPPLYRLYTYERWTYLVLVSQATPFAERKG